MASGINMYMVIWAGAFNQRITDWNTVFGPYTVVTLGCESLAADPLSDYPDMQ